MQIAAPYNLGKSNLDKWDAFVKCGFTEEEFTACPCDTGSTKKAIRTGGI
jgi:hypothetical protein